MDRGSLRSGLDLVKFWDMTAFPEVSLACTIICAITSMDGGSLVSKSITWIFSGNLYPVDLRWAKIIATLFKDGAGCEDWATFMSRSSLNGTNTPEIPGVAYLALRAEIRPAVEVWVWNLPFRESER